MDLPRPFDVLETVGEKSKSKAPRALKFGTKQVPINRELNRVLLSERPMNKKQDVYDYYVTI